MIKADLQGLINTKLASGSDILASELREVQTAYVDEFFASETNLNTIGGASATPVNLYFKKVGNTVFLRGTIQEVSGNMQGGNAEICTIPSSVLFGKTGITFQFTGSLNDIYSGASYDFCPFIILNDKIQVAPAGVMFPNTTYIINAQYTTND